MCESDKQTILKLGGPSKVAELVGASRQRTQNWMTRGIPARVKLQFPQYFLVDSLKGEKK